MREQTIKEGKRDRERENKVKDKKFIAGNDQSNISSVVGLKETATVFCSRFHSKSVKLFSFDSLVLWKLFTIFQR